MKQESDKLSVFYENSVSLQVGQQPLLISVTESSKPKTLWVLRGITFVDVTNEPVIPSFVITNDEYFALASMLGHSEFCESEDEVLIERTLPHEIDDIKALIEQMRLAKL
jgi:hypothetical protein